MRAAEIEAVAGDALSGVGDVARSEPGIVVVDEFRAAPELVGLSKIADVADVGNPRIYVRIESGIFSGVYPRWRRYFGEVVDYKDCPFGLASRYADAEGLGREAFPSGIAGSYPVAVYVSRLYGGNMPEISVHCSQSVKDDPVVECCGVNPCVQDEPVRYCWRLQRVCCRFPPQFHLRTALSGAAVLSQHGGE